MTTQHVLDPADLRRYRELAAMQETIAAEMDAIKAKWRQLPPGNHDGVIVAIPQRFSAELAHQWITAHQPDLLPAVQETVISQARCKQILPPIVYQQCTTAGQPTVRVR